MHPSIQYEIMTARVADWHSEADRARAALAARAASQAGHVPHRQGRRTGFGVLARRLLVMPQRLGSMRS